MNNICDVLKECERIANENYDGHFTIMKFTTNWKFCFGQPNNYEEIQLMATGWTMEEAVEKGIKEYTNASDFYKIIGYEKQ